MSIERNSSYVLCINKRDWVVSCKTDTWEYRLSCIQIDIDYGILDEPWVLDWVVSCETDTWEYRLSRIRIDIDYSITEEPWVLDWVVFCKTLKNTDRVISWLILTKVLLDQGTNTWTSDLWKETVFSKSPYQECIDFLSRTTNPWLSKTGNRGSTERNFDHIENHPLCIPYSLTVPPYS